jgi:hypothetical protein
MPEESDMHTNKPPVRAIRTLKSQQSLELGMATIAKDAVLAALAATEVNGLGFCGLEFYRREAGAGMAAVTDGLTLAQSTGAPVVALTCLHLNGIWPLLRDCWY